MTRTAAIAWLLVAGGCASAPQRTEKQSTDVMREIFESHPGLAAIVARADGLTEVRIVRRGAGPSINPGIEYGNLPA
jgi:hypothetical protein